MEKFNKALKQLNNEQRKAANIIDGPVLIIAPAGSGKTTTMGVRVGNMIRSEAMVNPNNILALTYTDAGAVAMRRKLVDFFGAEAHQVNIHTFHSFCNYVVTSNLEYFGVKHVEPLTDIERVDMVYQIIDTLPPDNILSRLKGDVYFETYRLIDLFQKMSEEHWTVYRIEKAVKEYLADLPNREEFIYKKANKKIMIKDEETGEMRHIVKGDPKINDIKAEKEKMERLIEAAKLFDPYKKILKKRERYDYHDMINWVIDAFRDNPNFLSRFQERYQYILIDEFQDTSRSQLILAGQIMDFWDHPNIFVVGDPDQCLYEFSGARLQNMNDFIEKYKPSVIFTEKNYRSSPDILKHAGKVIINNKIRHIQDFRMSATRISNAKDQVKLFEFSSTNHEEQWIIEQISSLYKSGYDMKEVAVLYRKHRQAENMSKILNTLGIPVNVKRSVNVLEQPIVLQIITILKFIRTKGKEQLENLIYNILHYGFIEAESHEINTVLCEIHDTAQGFYDYSCQHWDLVHKKLNEIREITFNQPLIKSIEHIIEKLSIVSYLLTTDSKYQSLTYLKTFFDFVRSETLKNPLMTVEDLLDYINKMNERSIPLPSLDLNYEEEGVTFSTCHGSKGLEWNKVFIMGVTADQWEKSRARSNHYPLPDTLSHESESDKLETNRRLFYVAMTRAKDNLVISYSTKNEEGKELVRSQFIEETELQAEQQRPKDQDQYIINVFTPSQPVFVPDIDTTFLKEKIEHLQVSPSLLNKFLRCGKMTYYENILRVPFVPDANLVYGNAVHHALKEVYDNYKNKDSEVEGSVDSFLDYFMVSLHKQRGYLGEKEYERLINLGKQVLPIYYDERIPSSNKITLNEYRVRNMTIEGIPVKGDIDKIEFYGELTDLIDYKTGNPVSVKKGARKGNDIWRQMIMYAIMINEHPSQPWKPRNLYVDVISNKPMLIPIKYDNEDVSQVKKEIKETREKLDNLEFPACGECYWCRNFI